MISKVTESNRELIDARIEQINEALEANGSSTRISSFESYYANIIEISKLATNFQNAPYKFFLMPLDEPMFEIDANKRTISVPSVFNKNGVGVYGDHKAEVLYFRIDKYFDYQDLFNVDQIIINWQFRPANASRNAELEVKTSIALAPDDTFDPGHIVFGWVITNEMTPSKGVLTFSVSFLKRNGSTYQYLFSTQPASVNINDTLILEDPSKLDSLNAPIFERLSDSRFTPENVTELVDPVFRTGIADEETGLLKGLPKDKNFEIIGDPGSEEEENSIKLQVIGRVPDDGTIAYTWSGTKFASGELVGGEASTVVAYVKTQDRAPVENIHYFVNNNGEIVELEDSEKAAAFADPTVDVLEEGSEFEITESGNYMVSLQSIKTVSQSDGDVIVKSGNVQSQSCAVPLAAVPSVQLSVQGLTPEAGNYSIYDPQIADQYVFIDASTPTVQATIGIDEDKIWNAEENTGVQGVTSGSEIGFIALKMTDAEGDEGKPDAEEISAMEANNEFVRRHDGDSFNVDSASANGEGVYKVYAVNKRNHTYSVSDASNELNVSLIAPVLSQINVEMEREEDENLVLISNNARTADATIEITAADPSRDFIISVGDDLTHVESLEAKVLEIYANDYEADPSVITYLKDREGNPDLPNFYEPELIEGSNNQFKFSISGDPGYFVIELTAKYHGTQRVTVTAPFNITSSSSFDS